MLLYVAVVTGEYILTIAGSGTTGPQNNAFDLNGSGTIDTGVDGKSVLLANPSGLVVDTFSGTLLRNAYSLNYPADRYG